MLPRCSSNASASCAAVHSASSAIARSRSNNPLRSEGKVNLVSDSDRGIFTVTYAINQAVTVDNSEDHIPYKYRRVIGNPFVRKKHGAGFEPGGRRFEETRERFGGWLARRREAPRVGPSRHESILPLSVCRPVLLEFRFAHSEILPGVFIIGFPIDFESLRRYCLSAATSSVSKTTSSTSASNAPFTASA